MHLKPFPLESCSLMMFSCYFFQSPSIVEILLEVVPYGTGVDIVNDMISHIILWARV